jgi:hypothetical protein
MPVLLDEDVELQGLMLVPVGGQYRRIGTFSAGALEGFVDEAQQDVELI